MTVSQGARRALGEFLLGALAAETERSLTVGDPERPPGQRRRPIGEESAVDIPRTTELFKPGTNSWVLLPQNFVPALATAAAYLVFRFMPIA